MSASPVAGVPAPAGSGQRLLEAVFGDAAVRSLAARAREDLTVRGREQALANLRRAITAFPGVRVVPERVPVLR